MSSKEIAQAIGLSPQTVDTYVKSAMAKLDAENRREAARLLATWEASQELGSQSATVAERAELRNQVPATGDGGRLSWLGLPPIGGSINELGAAQRFYAVLKVALVGAVAVFALALAVAGVLYTFR